MPDVPDAVSALVAERDRLRSALRQLACEGAALWMNLEVPHGADQTFVVALSLALNELGDVPQAELHSRAEALARRMAGGFPT